ncbi:Chitinase, partial [Phytophthora megakarya]
MKFASVIASMGLLSVAAAQSEDYVQSPVQSPEQQSSPEVTPCPTEATSSSQGPSSFARFFDQERFHEMFPDAVELYNFDGLVNAADKYTEFANTGNDTNDKRELAAFLAQTAHESDNFKAPEEYARNTYTVWQYCDNTTYPCAPGRRYHGRGPIQLSWNYNYYNAGKALGIDLLDNPDIVANDTAVTWMTAL